jgi:cell surface protein SprA
LSVATAFEPIGKQENDFFSQAYQNFLDFRPQVANRIAAERGAPLTDSDGDGYPDGFGPTSRDVLVTSFLAAYSGADPNQQKTSPFIDIPLPNWRINYDGLTKIKFFKDRFRSITISHAYRSTYQIGNYQTDLRFEDANGDGFSDLLDDADNFIPEFQIAQVSVQESFSPLIKFDATMLNSLIASVEMSRTRNLALNFSNNQLTEIRGNEYRFGLGYRFKDVSFIVNSGGSRKRITSDLNVKADVGIRQNLNVVRRITEQTNNATGGQTLVNIQISADYIISQRFNVRAFFDRTVTRYETSMAFDTWNTNVGISLRFILGQ